MRAFAQKKFLMGSLAVVLGLFFLAQCTPGSGEKENQSSAVAEAREGFRAIPKNLTSRPSTHEHEISLSTTDYMGKGLDYRIGSDDAPIIIHEFVDFECQACQMASSILKEIREEHPENVLLVFRNYPLDQACNKNINRKFHENSCAIAKLARCAGRSGKFWEFHDLAFAGQKSASLEQATKWAEQVGMSTFEVNNCLQDESVLAKIQDDISQGDAIGVEGTPAIYINGVKFSGDFNSLRLYVKNLVNAQTH